MKRHGTVQKHIARLLVVCLLFEMIPTAMLTTAAAAVDTVVSGIVSAIPEKAGEITFPYTHMQESETPEVRSLAELKASEAVTLDAESNVVKIDLNVEEFSADFC